MVLDIKGQLNNIRLSESKSLWPLFEAVVNAIQAIEESENKNNGRISIFARRESDYGQQKLDQNASLERIESFVVKDNGIGLNDTNYESFNTAYSTLKIQKGCKGIGRFLWLKAFNSVRVSSVYRSDESFLKREFSFTENGVDPLIDNVVRTNETNIGTEVMLEGFKMAYKNAAPVELDVIAKKIIEHCLPFFILGNCPEIILFDDVSDSVNLNLYYEKNIKDTLHQDTFLIDEQEFILYHLRLPEGATTHEVHFCANMQEVESVDLKKYIPDLQKKIITDDAINVIKIRP
ncbi:MAG: hypothetical protein NC299_15735 [Lachnospiraceae bacterium]|nr:hypothetical protein [Ruminococcus sp.]MCM1276785.1 hypothetical protein [Lachnospiraceae bacterium]